MTITKIEHCCLLLQMNGVNIITDPGMFSDAQNELKDIHAIIITHEHADHYHADSVKAILKNNPGAVVITNTGVGKQLETIGVTHTIIEGRQSATVNNIVIEAFDCKHEEIYEEMGQVQNTGYLIGNELFIPGDSFQASHFEKPVPVLALPVAGPWCKIPDAIRYALHVKPAKAFPVHDAMIKPGSTDFMYQILTNILKQSGIEFVPMAPGDKKEF